MKRTPLHPIQVSQGAVFSRYGDWELAAHFGEVAGEYRAACTGAGVVDWGFHTLVRLKGEDRVDFLHRLVSNDVRLEKGQGTHAFLLSVNGRPQVEMWVYERGEEYLLEVPQALKARLLQELDRYHFGERIAVQDAGEEFAGLAIVGPRAREVLESLHAQPLPDLPPCASTPVDLEGVPALACHSSRCPVPAWLLWVPRSRAAAAWETLLGAEPTPAKIGMEALEILRVEAGVPAYGVDYDEERLFLEMAPPDSFSQTKGCYPGQEVVERVLARGHTNRRLLGVRLPRRAEPGEKLLAGEKEVGQVTSSVESPALGFLGLAYVRRGHQEPGTELDLERGGRARVAELPFQVGGVAV